MPASTSSASNHDQRPFPEGWFCVAPRGTLPRGSVRTQALAGRDVVVFRTHDGDVGVVDAYCPHLGAHLGHGGRVVGDSIRCPFHGFRWRRDGSCAGTEYADDPKVPMRLGAWPVREVHGHVLTWWSEAGGAPAWELPAIDTEGWTDPFTTTLALRANVEDVTENGVDLGHFGAVHRYFDVKEPVIENFDRPILHSRFGFSRANPFSASLAPVTSIFDTQICGLGFSLTDLTIESLAVHCRLYLFATQLDAQEMSFTISISADRRREATSRRLGRLLRSRAATRLFVRFLMRKVLHDVEQDRAIWENRRHLERPGLVKGDGPIPAFRRWTRQFYPAEEAARSSRVTVG
jgi:phenylpropionate dioxygenase-like ring-hydroxylating dioxygenase large terminal subunit